MGREFKASWYNCISAGPVNCVYAYCCPCFAVADVSKAAGIQDDYFFDCLCVSPAVLRNQYRRTKGVDGHCSGDCCLSLCPCCPLVQMMNDLGSDFKLLNVTGDDLKKAVMGVKDVATAEARKGRAQVKGAPVAEEMTR